MAIRWQEFDDKDDREGQAAQTQPTKRSRITIDVSPELRRRIKVAASRSELSISEYLGRILEQTIPAEEHIMQPIGRPVSRESIECLRHIREEILQDRNGKLFENSAELIRQMREERSKHLEEVTREK